MKIKFYKLLLITVSVLLISSFFGCTVAFRTNSNPNSPNENYTTESNLPNSVEKSEYITYNHSNRTDSPYEDLDLLISETKLNRASVAIYLPTDSGYTSGCGTIVDISKNGENEEDVYYILTCYHVIANKGDIIVYVPDTNGRNYGDLDYEQDALGNYVYEFKGKIGGNVDKTQAVSLVGGDKESDVAILRLYVADKNKSKNIVKAKIMNPEYTVSLGQKVFAIGNPTGTLPGTVSSGYIAYINRYQTINGIGEITLLQINVDIYAGSSGGGLFNMYGELIGITNSGNTEDIGINYAVPIKIYDDPVKDNGFLNIVKQLLGTYSDYNYGYISSRRQKFDFTVTQSASLETVTVSVVTSGGIADLAGLKVNDVLEKVKGIRNGVEDAEWITVSKNSDMTNLLESLDFGDSIILHVIREVTTRYGFGSYRTTTEEHDITLTVVRAYFCNTGIYS